MRSIAAIIFLAVGAGCAPSIEDGIYGCDTGLCPDGLACWVNRLCYRGEDPFGDPCDSDGDCGEHLVCAPGMGDARETGTYCSMSCTTDDECNGLGTNSFCVEGVCRYGCEEPMDCPPGTDTGCYLVPPETRTMPTSGGVCVRVTGVVPRTGCMSMMCNEPGRCQWAEGYPDLGVCTLDCLSHANCFDGTECVPVFTMARSMCIAMCDPAGAGGCAGDLVCTYLNEPTGSTYCVPSEWEGMGGMLTRPRPSGAPP